MFSPELRVKRFLDSIGYYLLYGQTDGIITSYKEAMHEAREIPASSCPGIVSNILYASGGATDETAREEDLNFRAMTEMLDMRRKPVPEKGKTPSMRRKLEMVREDNAGNEVYRYRVDTDGYFLCGGELKQIRGVRQYQPKTVTRRSGETDILYDMDMILRCGDRWYDMRGDIIPDECVTTVG